MTKVNEIYTSPWLRAEDLQGRSVRVKIEAAAVETIRQSDGTEQPRIVVSFASARKRLILNKTQAGALAAIAGGDTDGWIGREVLLSPMPSAQPGKMTIGVMAVPEAAAGDDRDPF